MRVLYFHQHFSTQMGAGGTRSYEFARDLVARGHQVTMVCGSNSISVTGLDVPPVRGVRSGTVDGIEVVEFCVEYSNQQDFLTRTKIFLKFATFSTRVALTYPVDLIFATTTPLTVAIPAILARWLRGLPFVFEVRDLWPELPRAMGVIKNPFILGAMGILEWLAYHSADFLIGLSPGIVQGICRRGIADGRVVMIPNGCDTDLFMPTDGVGIIPIPGINQGDFVAIFCGAHGIANGLAAVLDTAKVLKQRGRLDIFFVFVGDGKLKPALVNRARAEGLDHCIFLDSMPKRDLAKVVGGADLGLMILDNVPAFYYGTSPNKFFDYLASGLPVLTNYPGWVADLVQHHRCGVAVPPRNPVAFAEAMIALADRREQLPALGQNARRLAETDFQRKILTSRFVETLENVYRRYALRVFRFRLNCAVKRTFDFMMAMGALFFLSPILLLLAVVVRIYLGGPVFFCQLRPGQFGRPFLLWKFRTMNNARDAQGKLLADAQRLTFLGRFLRRTSLDELPELWNILKGDMSLVGPRPLLIRYLSRYTPRQARRHEVRPGLTGWAQVNGRNALSWDDKFELDVWYVDHRSFVLDLQILWKTVKVVLLGRGTNAPDSDTMTEFLGNTKDR